MSESSKSTVIRLVFSFEGIFALINSCSSAPKLVAEARPLSILLAKNSAYFCCETSGDSSASFSLSNSDGAP